MTTPNDKQDLFASIAALAIHDVKNNLIQVASNAEVYGDLNSINILQSASQTLTRLLYFYRSENHDLYLQIDAHDPHELVTDLIENVSKRLREQSGISIEINTEQAPSIGFYDRSLIEMVLCNALQNAMRFACKRIEVGVIGHPDKLEFYVQDDGAGYPITILEDQDSYSHVNTNGTGIGIRFARRALALHQNNGCCGQIVLSNANGALFQLYLP